MKKHTILISSIAILLCGLITASYMTVSYQKRTAAENNIYISIPGYVIGHSALMLGQVQGMQSTSVPFRTVYYIEESKYAAFIENNVKTSPYLVDELLTTNGTYYLFYLENEYYALKTEQTSYRLDCSPFAILISLSPVLRFWIPFFYGTNYTVENEIATISLNAVSDDTGILPYTSFDDYAKLYSHLPSHLCQIDALSQRIVLLCPCENQSQSVRITLDFSAFGKITIYHTPMIVDA